MNYGDRILHESRVKAEAKAVEAKAAAERATAENKKAAAMRAAAPRYQPSVTHSDIPGLNIAAALEGSDQRTATQKFYDYYNATE
jgi:hypothetical protein